MTIEELIQDLKTTYIDVSSEIAGDLYSEGYITGQLELLEGILFQLTGDMAIVWAATHRSIMEHGVDTG